MIKKPALIVDINNTINRNKNGKDFIDNSDSIEIIPGSIEILTFFKNQGFFIIGCSNQGGIAFGFKTKDDVVEEMMTTMSLVGDSLIDDIFFNGCHKDGIPFEENRVDEYVNFSFRSLCRKPEIGLLALAEVCYFQNKKIIDWDSSIFLGDMWEDQECARRAGIPFFEIKQFHEQFFQTNPQERSLDCIYKFKSNPILPR